MGEPNSSSGFPRSCRSFASTAQSSPLVLQRVCAERSPCAASDQRLVPSCGEHRGRGWKGWRRPKSLCFLPTSTPRRTRLIADAAPLPAAQWPLRVVSNVPSQAILCNSLLPAPHPARVEGHIPPETDSVSQPVAIQREIESGSCKPVYPICANRYIDSGCLRRIPS